MMKQSLVTVLSPRVYATTMLRRASSFAPMVATCGALFSALVAIIGYTLLGFLFFTRYYAPASHHYIRPLHFDYTGYVAVAVAPLLTNLREQVTMDNHKALTGAAAAILPKSRFLPSGTQVSIHVYLTIPSEHTDLFQVTGELVTNASHVAARSSRTHINTPQPYAYRLAKQIMLMPFHIVGWGHGDWAHVDLPLFETYEEREDAPVAYFRARLASRNASRGALPPPPVYKAELHVRLRLGLIQTALFWLRPGLAASIIVLVMGLSAAVGGTCGTLGLALLAWMLRRWVVAGAGGKQFRSEGAFLAAPPGRRPKHIEGQPYGSVEDAMSYSLSHANFYGGDAIGAAGGVGANVPTAFAAGHVADHYDDDDVDVSYAGHMNGKASRQGTAHSVTYAYGNVHGTDEEEDVYSHAAKREGAGHPAPEESSPAWSGSSADVDTATGVTTVRSTTPSRQGSDSQAVKAEGTRTGLWEEEGARREERQPNELIDNHGGRGDLEAADSGMEGDEGDVGASVIEEGEKGQGGVGHKAANEDEEESGDLDPQADNTSTGGMMRRRSAFAWHA